jgi:hypothetical protein
VKDNTSWIEDNYYINGYATSHQNNFISFSRKVYDILTTLLLHKQMELYSLTLRYCINKINQKQTDFC